MHSINIDCYYWPGSVDTTMNEAEVIPVPTGHYGGSPGGGYWNILSNPRQYLGQSLGLWCGEDTQCTSCSPRHIFKNLVFTLEKCKSKLQWDIISHQSEWPSSKNLETINAGEGVEKREPSCTVGGNVNWYSHYGEQYGVSLKN